MTDKTRRRPTGQIIAGVVLVLLGITFFMDELGSTTFYDIGQLWPLIVVAVGASRLLSAESPRQRRGALVVLFIGGWLLISSLQLFGLDFDRSWPLVLMAVGLASLIAGGNRQRVKGTFLILLGGWMLAVVLNYRGLTWENAWPLMLVVGGIYIVATAFLPRLAHGSCCDCEECCP